MHYPMIGVSGSLDRDETKQFVLLDYMKCLANAGCIPVLLTPAMTPEELNACVERLDGLMLAGGNDVDPNRYQHAPIPELGEVNPLRDAMEIALIHTFRKAGKPILGICRGLQMINVALGGTLYQDLSAQYCNAAQSTPMAHGQTSPARYPSHPVAVNPDSLLHRLVDVPELWVNSFHHQALWDIAPGLTVCASAGDGVIEAAEDSSQAFMLGVQWHPERMAETDVFARKLFEGFVLAAKR